MLIQALSLLGAGLILLAFAMLQFSRWRAEQAAYIWANLLGAAALTVVAWVERQWGFLLLETVWAAVSAWALLKLARQS